MSKVRATLAGLSFLLASSTALAHDVYNDARLDNVETKVEKLERHIERLELDKKANKEKKIEIVAVPEVVIEENLNAAKFKLAPGPRFTDGDFTFAIKGLVMTDMAFFNEDKQHQSDGFTIRNARVNFSGDIQDWFYEVETSFGGGSAGISTALLGYKFTDKTKVYLGQIDAPFSMEEQMSSKWTTFMERGSVNALVPGLNIGTMLETSGENYSLVAGVFGDGVNTISTDDSAVKFVARGTVAPYLTKDKVVHLGLSGDYETSDNVAAMVRYQERPESRLAAFAVDTGDISNVDTEKYVGGEFAVGAYGALLESEYLWHHMKRSMGFADSRFNAGHATLSYVLTGEHRSYDAASGTFGGVTPARQFSTKDGNFGAWEIATRYNFINLKSGNVNGGSMHNWGAALNWYPSDYVKFAANYIWVNANKGDYTPKDNPRIFMMRAQIWF